MAIKNITSSDPRKAHAVANLKRVSGATACTMVQEQTRLGVVVAHCLTKGLDGRSFGWWGVEFDSGRRMAGPCIDRDTAFFDCGWADDARPSITESAATYTNDLVAQRERLGVA